MGLCYSSPVPSLENTIAYVPKVKSGYVIKVYDGDTITIASRISGDNTLYRFPVRLIGIDCPEMKDQTQKEIALIAQKTLSDRILHKTVKLHDVSLDKYGRLLARVEYKGIDMSSLLLDSKLAVPYDGGKKSIINWNEYYNGK